MTPPLRGVPTIEVETVLPDPAQQAEADATQIQALAEGVVHGDQLECLGGHYKVAEKIGLMPLLKFAYTASSGVGTEDLDGLVAIYSMLRDCIDPEDWDRFERDMIAKKAEADDMMPCVEQAIEIINARPTRQRSVSSSGPQSTGQPSTGGSSPRPGVEDLVPVDRLAEAL